MSIELLKFQYVSVGILPSMTILQDPSALLDIGQHRADDAPDYLAITMCQTMPTRECDPVP